MQERKNKERDSNGASEVIQGGNEEEGEEMEGSG